LWADCVAFPFGALAEADGGVDWVMCRNVPFRMCKNPADF
jgi:hypothetical protein